MGEDRLERLDYYELLRVSPTASPEEIRRAFHEFALRYHPDRHAGAVAEHAERAARIYRRGAEAYRVLMQPERRARYDRLLASGQLRYAEPTRSEERASQRPAGAIDVRSPRARPFAQQALEAEKRGDLAKARLNFLMALQHEPDNEMLRSKLEDVTARLKGS